jgi:hypothetical protein
VEEDIFYQGEVCGKKRTYSDQLLMFALRARKPDMYRERSSMELTQPPSVPDDSPYRGLSKEAIIAIKTTIANDRRRNQTLEAAPQPQPDQNQAA